MKEVEMICLMCPLGCKIIVHLDEDDRVTDMSGFTCKKGKEYAMQEITDPQRVIPTSIKVIGGVEELVSVKTTTPVPKRLMWEIMDIVLNAQVRAPVRIGQTIVANIASTGADIVATREVAKS